MSCLDISRFTTGYEWNRSLTVIIGMRDILVELMGANQDKKYVGATNSEQNSFIGDALPEYFYCNVRLPVGAENAVTSGDLRILVEEAAEPVASENADVVVGDRGVSPAVRWSLA